MIKAQNVLLKTPSVPLVWDFGSNMQVFHACRYQIQGMLSPLINSHHRPMEKYGKIIKAQNGLAKNPHQYPICGVLHQICKLGSKGALCLFILYIGLLSPFLLHRPMEKYTKLIKVQKWLAKTPICTPFMGFCTKYANQVQNGVHAC